MNIQNQTGNFWVNSYAIVRLKCFILSHSSVLILSHSSETKFIAMVPSMGTRTLTQISHGSCKSQELPSGIIFLQTVERPFHHQASCVVDLVGPSAGCWKLRQVDCPIELKSILDSIPNVFLTLQKNIKIFYFKNKEASCITLSFKRTVPLGIFPLEQNCTHLR